METRDVVTIAMSAGALCFSIASFALTFKQRSIEDRRGTRKSLTDTVAEISKVNLARAQLDLDSPGSATEAVVVFRRNYNVQLRYLANHCEFLADQILGLVTDVDCLVIGGAFEASHDYDRAGRFYSLAIDRAPNPVLKSLALRVSARFWFNRGNPARGRKNYEESLQLDVPDTDAIRQLVADTYMLWAKAEHDYGFEEQSQRIRELARAATTRIAYQRLRDDMFKQLDEALPLNHPRPI